MLGLRLLLLPLDEGLRLPLLNFLCIKDSSEPDLLDADLIFPSFTCACLRLLFLFLLLLDRLPLLLLRLPLLKLLLPLELLLSLEYDRDRRLSLLLLPDFFSTAGEGERDFLICFPSLSPLEDFFPFPSLACSGEDERGFFLADEGLSSHLLLLLVRPFSVLIITPPSLSSPEELPLDEGGGTGGDGAPGDVGLLSISALIRFEGGVASFFFGCGDLLALREDTRCFFAFGFLSRLFERDADRDGLLLLEAFMTRGGELLLLLRRESLPPFLARAFLSSRLFDRERDEKLPLLLRLPLLLEL